MRRRDEGHETDSEGVWGCRDAGEVGDALMAVGGSGDYCGMLGKSDRTHYCSTGAKGSTELRRKPRERKRNRGPKARTVQQGLG